MVTAGGIILGFVFNFTGSWAKEPASLDGIADYFIGAGLFTGITLLIIAIYRVLNNKYPPDKAGKYYRKTLFIFTSGIIFAFSGIVITIIKESFFKQ